MAAAFVAICAADLARPVFAQRTTAPAQTIVRIAPDDALLGGILNELKSLEASLVASAAVRRPVSGTFGRPVGQVGDALKVFPVSERPLDPCLGSDKGNVAISQTASTRLVVAHPGERIFVCAARVVAAAAEIPSFIEGTGATCGTGTLAVSGSTTAANGESYAANGGFAQGVGYGSIMVTTKVGDDLCLAQNGSQRLSGNIVYAYGKP
jgi:hypothetical protein